MEALHQMILDQSGEVGFPSCHLLPHLLHCSQWYKRELVQKQMRPQAGTSPLSNSLHPCHGSVAKFTRVRHKGADPLAHKP